MEHYSRWATFSDQLPLLMNCRFSRKMLHSRPINIQLHGFCDASQTAYGACFYIRSINSAGTTNTTLYCAKSRVAPIKTPQTIPRLELCAALLLSDLYSSIKTTINLKIDQVIFWTDSTIALHWINTSPHLLKTFVANRVAQIQQNTSPKNWRHVRTHDNPADALSRGQLPVQFKNNQLWADGPSWLRHQEEQWPALPLTFSPDVPEAKKNSLFTVHTNR